MRQIALVSSCAALLCSAAIGQDLTTSDFLQQFSKAIQSDDYATARTLVSGNQRLIRYAWLEGEGQYHSAVANASEKDKADRGGVMMKLAQLTNMVHKDGWYLDRWRWAEAQSAEKSTKLAALYEKYDRADREWARAQVEKTGELYAACAKMFAEIEVDAVEAGDPVFGFYSNWYLAACRRGEFKYYDAIYAAKRAIEAGREAKLDAVVDRESNLHEIIKKSATAASPEIDESKVDVRLSLDESKKKYEQIMQGGVPVPPGGEEGEKPAPGAEPAKPRTGTTPEDKDLPPLPNRHPKKEPVEVAKTKVREVNDKGFFSSNPNSNNPPLRWASYQVPYNSDTRLPIIPGDHKVINDQGKLLLDLDGDGKAAPEKLKLGGKPEVVKFAKRDLGSGVVADVYLRLMERPTSYKMMGFDSKDQPDRDGAWIHYACGMSVTGKFDGYDVTVFDDNGDGRFNTYVEDCVVVAKGSTKRVQPLSKTIYVGDLLYDFEIDADGKKFVLKPYEGALSLVKLDFGSGPPAQFLTARGLGERAEVAFNLMDARDKWMWVPSGEYQIAHGYFASGPEGDKRETITIEAGRKNTVSLPPGERVVWKAGGAGDGYRFVWRVEKKGNEVLLRGKDVSVYGAGGEKYEWFLPGVLRPQVRAKMGEKGSVFFDKQMGRIDAGMLTLDGSLRFYPRDIDFKLPGSGDLYMQLEENYPKLGKISSNFEPQN
jgi:hypothetical protein